jgi:large subunit ribosomal protein L19
MNKTEIFNKSSMKSALPDIRPGDIVKISQKVQDGDKTRIQEFEGLVLLMKHGKGISGSITVRKVTLGMGVEKIFPLHSPNIEKIEILKRGKVRRAKLYYLRSAKGKKARLKRTDYQENMPEKEIAEIKTEEPKPEAKEEVKSEEK